MVLFWLAFILCVLLSVLTSLLLYYVFASSLTHSYYYVPLILPSQHLSLRLLSLHSQHPFLTPLQSLLTPFLLTCPLLPFSFPSLPCTLSTFFYFFPHSHFPPPILSPLMLSSHPLLLSLSLASPFSSPNLFHFPSHSPANISSFILSYLFTLFLTITHSSNITIFLIIFVLPLSPFYFYYYFYFYFYFYSPIHQGRVG